jgi:hypothetical protein
VRSLADAEFAPGRYNARWDGLDDAGSRVADGLYFARLEAGGRVLREKLVACH